MGITTAGHASSVYLLPGMSVKLDVSHFFVRNSSVLHRYSDGSTKSIVLTNGFVVDNENVGKLTALEGPSVIYKHNRFEYNIITFYALTGEKGRVYVMSVPVHDHSSIVAGGPAYGTYFSDDQTVIDET